MPKTIHLPSRQSVLESVRKVAAPVVSTLSPQGSNVIFEGAQGIGVTNDGWTIINAMEFEDRVDNAIHSLIRDASGKTNVAAGDGTTSTVLFVSKLVEEGVKMLDEGATKVSVKKALDNVSKRVSELLDNPKNHRQVRSSKDLAYVARVSSNDDIEVARHVVDAVESAGDEGLVFIEASESTETNIVKDDGFMIDSGVHPMLTNQPGKMLAMYKDVKVFVTDKRLYHDKEALAILEPLFSQGITQVVIVARDFLGQAKNTFLTNHKMGKMQILLVKDPEATDQDVSTLEDLAAYLGTQLVTDKAGRLANQSITLKDFGTARRVIADRDQTLMYGKAHPELKLRISSLRDELKTAKGDTADRLRKRLARITSGTVTIQVGGKTPPETRERMFRYEDAVHATKAAKKDGYVVGGGLTLFGLMHLGIEGELEQRFFQVLGTASLKQIALNCSIEYKEMLMRMSKGNIGYNAASGQYEDLLKAGVIEPTTVVKMAVQNAASVASIILSSQFIITTDNATQDR